MSQPPTVPLCTAFVRHRSGWLAAGCFVTLAWISPQDHLPATSFVPPAHEAYTVTGSAAKLHLHYQRWRSSDASPPAWPGRLRTPAKTPRHDSVTGTVLLRPGRDLEVHLAEASEGPYEVWLELMDGRSIDLGTSREGRIFHALDPETTAELDRVVVKRGNREVLVATPDLFERLGDAEGRRVPGASALETIGGLALGASGAQSQPNWTPADFESLVAFGEELFFEETFAGNGRTCGTCHPAENNFTIDPEFIDTLPPSDPLFVAEYVPALDAKQNGGQVFENPTLMRRFGLIVENLDGFDDLANRFVMRSVQPTLGLAQTIEPAPNLSSLLVRHFTGWGGDGAPEGGSLREFAIGAVRQHFPLTTARVPGQDFRLPTSLELSALEAFQLSLGRTETPELFGLNFRDPQVELGVQAFQFAGACNFCHFSGGSGVTTSLLSNQLDTGVEAFTQNHPDGTGELRPVDGGFGTNPSGDFRDLTANADGSFGNQRFNSPSLIELADTLPAFHSHLTANPASGLPNTVEGAVSFYNSQEFNDAFGLVVDLTDDEIAQIGKLLRVLNALENLRTVEEYAERGRAELLASLVRLDRVDRVVELALLESEDAMMVLEQVSLHPVARQELLEVQAELTAAQSGAVAQRLIAIEAALANLPEVRADILE